MTSIMSQGEAVFQAVNEVLEGCIEGAVDLSDSQTEAVYAKVLLAFQEGRTVHSKNPDEATLRKYIPGLVNNWLRKDTRLNGGTKYTTKNPGSRAGSGDETVRTMKALLSITEDEAARATIQAEIDRRVASLRPVTKINVDLLPESLRHLVLVKP